MPRKIYPGTNVLRIESGRKAQVSSLTETHAQLYWPDANRQTEVQRRRLESLKSEWKILDELEEN